jgi:hypothetical protein
VPAGLWKWTTRVDTTLATPQYQITDIISPFGLLRDSIPLPGDVVSAMAASIDEIKAALAPAILVGPPSSLSFSVDEGRGFSPVLDLRVSNVGPYGSILGPSLTAHDSYVRVAPANLGPLATSQTGISEVSVDSTNLQAVQSPYATTITVQDPNSTNGPMVVPVAITVRPRAVVATSPVTLTFIATPLPDGSFTPIPYQQLLVMNSGPSGSVLEYLIQRLTSYSSWLTSFTPSSGTVAAGGSQPVQVVVEPINGMASGTYQETLRVSGYSLNYHVDVTVQLTIL